MKVETELEKIQRIMNRPDDEIQLGKDVMNYFDKIKAIQNWAENSGVKFDTELVDNCESFLMYNAKLSHKQKESLDNIISNFRIDLNYWGV